MNIPEAIIILLTLNYILDYPLQGDFLAKYKAEKNYLLFVHCFIWAGGMSIGLMFVGIFALWKFLMLFIGHFLMDGWKCKKHYKKYGISDWDSLYIDQGFHIVQALLCLF